MSYPERKQLSDLDTLKNGLRLLIQDGWTQGDYVKPVLDADGQIESCKRCAYGALEEWNLKPDGVFTCSAIAGIGARNLLKQAMFDVDSAGFVPGRMNIAVWNDKDHRTEAQVIAAFERAIDLAEAIEAGER